jgi:putative transposase
VKHGYVTRVCDWPHSSFHRYVKKALLPADWGWRSGRDRGSLRGVNRSKGLSRAQNRPDAVPG